MAMKCGAIWLLGLGCAAAHGQVHQHDPHQHQHPAHSEAPTTSEDASAFTHVPPAPPSHVMPPMSVDDMNAIMAMDDTERYGKLTINEAEWADDDSFAWDVDAWYGGDQNKLWIQSAGVQHSTHESFSVEALWDRVFTRWWSIRSGLRHDEQDAEPRTSLIIGLQGLAPQWFDVESSLYLRDNGVLTWHGEVDYDLLLTQRLILQPMLEVTANSKNDIERAAGSGLSNLELGLRLRYELRREFAPYLGIQWECSFDNTADYARAEDRDVSDLQIVVGLRAWF
jgi:copper resistance protein B